jgi:diadenosine tetraphosphatase ApaH/serine/threonine PP2A family protein phosphatase
MAREEELQVMCAPGQAPAAPVTAAAAVAMAQAGLGWLATADAGSLSAAEQADCLRGLEHAASMHTAARAQVLAAFHGQSGYEDDGHGSAKTWLKWRTRITDGAAAGAMGWMRRLAAHPAVRDAMASGEISQSWAHRLCEWTDALPEESRADGDAILLGAAAGGAELADLGRLADELRRLTAAPDDDGDDGFTDRRLRLDTTFRGAGKLDGDLTPGCTAALSAVLEALGKRAGPEDLRTKWQRDHDALEEACRRLVAVCIKLAGVVPHRMARDGRRRVPAGNLRSRLRRPLAPLRRSGGWCEGLGVRACPPAPHNRC